MTDIENEARRRLNEARETLSFSCEYNYEGDESRKDYSEIEAMCRLLEEFEAFKQEVSDAVENVLANRDDVWLRSALRRVILPKPKPDPLEAVAKELRETYCATSKDWSKALREALAARGYEIREKAGE